MIERDRQFEPLAEVGAARPEEEVLGGLHRDGRGAPGRPVLVGAPRPRPAGHPSRRRRARRSGRPRTPSPRAAGAGEIASRSTAVRSTGRRVSQRPSMRVETGGTTGRSALAKTTATTHKRMRPRPNLDRAAEQGGASVIGRLVRRCAIPAPCRRVRPRPRSIRCRCPTSTLVMTDPSTPFTDAAHRGRRRGRGFARRLAIRRRSGPARSPGRPGSWPPCATRCSAAASACGPSSPSRRPGLLGA